MTRKSALAYLLITAATIFTVNEQPITKTEINKDESYNINIKNGNCISNHIHPNGGTYIQTEAAYE